MISHEMRATEALIGMQNDCDAMQKLTKEEQNSLLLSVTQALRDVENETIDICAELARPFGRQGKYAILKLKLKEEK